MTEINGLGKESEGFSCRKVGDIGVFIDRGLPLYPRFAITLFANLWVNHAMPFLFNARYGLFTYSQSDGLDPFHIVELFAGLHAECIVGRESHEVEGIHYHAFVDFGEKFRTTDVRKFDVDGFHPNVVPSRGTPEKGYDYATKDGDVVAGGLERPEAVGAGGGGVAWSRIADAPSASDFWSLVRELAPRSLLTSFPSLRAYAEWNYRPERTPYEHPPTLTLDISDIPELGEWVRDNLSGTHVGKMSYSYGPGP